MLTLFFTQKCILQQKAHKQFSARVFTQKYFLFSKMDKKNVQKRKDDLLLCKKCCITINLENNNIIIIFLC